ERPRPPVFPYTTLFRSITNGTSADEVAQDRNDSEEDEEAEAEDSGSQSIPAESPSGSALITDSHVAYLTGSGGLFRPQDNLTRRSEEHTSELQSRFDLV